jgi:hypothetical protein
MINTKVICSVIATLAISNQAVAGEHSVEVRTVASELTDFAIDAHGTNLSHSRWVDSRVRVGSELELFGNQAVVEFDIMSGQILGDDWIHGENDSRRRSAFSGRGNILPRKLAMAGTSEIGSWQAGLVTSHWGLGMVANDGAQESWFGQSEFGDRVVRVRLTTTPFGDGRDANLPLYVTVAVDQVLSDDMADLIVDGSSATQFLSSALWKNSEMAAGFYGVLRHQRELEAERVTNAGMMDMFFDVPVATVGGLSVRLSGEGAVIGGQTDRATTYSSRDMVSVFSGGAVGRLEFGSQEDRVTLRMQGGWASGDSNPDDGTSSDFSFDRDFEVGAVLFDQFMAGVEVGTFALLTDPQYSGSPPDGVETIPTEGAFRRARFEQVAVRFNPSDSNRNLEVRSGLTRATATAPISQPFYTYRGGGSSRTHHNEITTGDALGVEFDWALSYAMSQVSLEVQGGHLFLSDDLAGDGASRIDLYTVSLTAGY